MRSNLPFTMISPKSLLLVAVCLLSACTLFREANSGSTEQTLIAAGFQARPADTPSKLARLKSLPPFKVVPVQAEGRLGYVYADPNQSMLYLGSPAEYQKFQQLTIQQNIAEENEMAAAENEMAADDWAWDGFGPYWW